MILHPSSRRILRVARTGDAASDPHLARHLLDCARCRAELEQARTVIEVARTMPLELSCRRGFAEIAGRIRAQDLEPEARRGLANVTGRAAGAPAARRPAAFVHVAAAAVVVIGLAIAVVGPREAGGLRSELNVAPAAPRAGEPLAITYRAGLISDALYLVVRARVRLPADPPRTERNVILGRISRIGTGAYQGTLFLPDSTVYAVLAIETEAGERVDVNGERWDVLIHGEDGRPLVAALLQRRIDANLRDLRLHDQTAADLTRLYPERPEGWGSQWIVAMASVRHDAIDSLNAYHRAHHLPALEAAMSAAPQPDALALGAMVFYARWIGASEAEARWRTELQARHPLHAFALGERAMEIHRAHADPRMRMAEYEAMWQEVGPTGTQLVVNALATAEHLRDPSLVRIWAERMERTDPSLARTAALALAGFPELTHDAATRLEREIEHALDAGNARRPLRYTTTEYRAVREREAGSLLFTLGGLLMEAGDTARALEVLERAAETGWDARRFATLAEAHLARGDTARGAALLARVAADPLTPPASVDSARLRLRSYADGAWTQAVAEATAAMDDYTAGEWISRRPRRSMLRLRSLDGARVNFALEGGVTVVAFWSQWCPYSIDRLPSLHRMAERLRAEGARILILTDDEDTSATAAFLRARGLPSETLVDADRDAAAAFDQRSLGSYVVLDAQGVIRFTGHDPEALPRQLRLLEGTDSGRPSSASVSGAPPEADRPPGRSPAHD